MQTLQAGTSTSSSSNSVAPDSLVWPFWPAAAWLSCNPFTAAMSMFRMQSYLSNGATATEATNGAPNDRETKDESPANVTNVTNSTIGTNDTNDTNDAHGTNGTNAGKKATVANCALANKLIFLLLALVILYIYNHIYYVINFIYLISSFIII